GPDSSPCVLTVPSFNLAVGACHWADNDAAIFGNLDGKNLGLVIPRSGKFVFDWSLRGTPRSGALHFDMHLPPCPAAVLELTAPANHQVIVPKGSVLLSGPDRARDSEKRVWRLEFGGRTKVEFQVRRPTDEGKPLILSQLQTRQEITPGRSTADY